MYFVLCIMRTWYFSEFVQFSSFFFFQFYVGEHLYFFRVVRVWLVQYGESEVS